MMTLNNVKIATSSNISFHFAFSMVKSSSSASPESGLGTSHTSLPGSGQGSANENAIGEDTYYETEVETLNPLGTCRALYPFEGEWIAIVLLFI